jgi:hypothetical protein
MKHLTVLTVVALLMVSCGSTAGNAASVSKEEILALDDEESMVLLECQGQKVYEELGPKEGEKYLKQEVDEVVKAALAEGPEVDKDPLLQYELAKDGYYCDAEERAQFVKDQRQAERQAEQEALWGPPRELQEANSGLFGGAFADEVKYELDDERTGNWMMVAKNKELKVSTTADSEAELVKLAETLKKEEAKDFDFVRIEYFGGKKDLDQQTYDAHGTICILNSEDGLLLFKDQYPMGPAAKQAEEDFKNDDGIVFLGSGE